MTGCMILQSLLTMTMAMEGTRTTSSSAIPPDAGQRRTRRQHPIRKAASKSPVPASAIVQETQQMLVVDMFSSSYQELSLIRGDYYVLSGCVRHGWMPVAALYPTVVISLHALEVFVRTLCNIHGVVPHPWLASQCLVALNIYHAICMVVDKYVEVALGRNAPDWHLKNTCPLCLYKLEGEPSLDLPLLFTMDGNNSLMRLETRKKDRVLEDGTTAPGALKELLHDHTAPGDYYLSRVEVDRWSKEGLEDLMKGFTPDAAEGDDEEDGRTERWQNMKAEVTVCAWGMYNETGIFPALCRHRFILVVVDMVRSSELSKYGFAVTAHILCVLGESASGYDIGCKFYKICQAHPILRDLVVSNNFKALVGSFHGHGHNHRCQTKNLTTYVKGVGLESLEGCESYFFKFNALTVTTCHTSGFHPQQAIMNYMKHTDQFDMYLMSVLCSKYCCALEIKATHSALCDAMQRLGVESWDVFEMWLEEEKQCVTDDLEMRMEIEAWRVEGDEKWEAAAEMVYKRCYQRALDHLEGLVVMRMFELAKCHMAGMGYVLRQHIVKALQARSKAIEATIIRYNKAAEEMEPPMSTLDWEEVVEFAFLADFDLLWEARQDIRQQPWASPAGHAAMDQHFKLLRADEEIQCLNIQHRDPPASHVGLLQMEHSRFTLVHMLWLRKLSKLPDFSVDLVPGVGVSREWHVPLAQNMEMCPPSQLEHAAEDGLPAQDNDEEHDEEHNDDERFTLAFVNIMRISSDASATGTDDLRARGALLMGLMGATNSVGRTPLADVAALL
ncbi:hypothetical protein B0H19DRAFT_1060400 [Mycena capillaripes]|nr:hypothetical protein B0H19DRAFT_1060400 [Mycena capillaripes]